MPAELIWTPKAEEDLIDIHAFIALENPAAADRVVDGLIAATAPRPLSFSVSPRPENSNL